VFQKLFKAPGSFLSSASSCCFSHRFLLLFTQSSRIFLAPDAPPSSAPLSLRPPLVLSFLKPQLIALHIGRRPSSAFIFYLALLRVLYDSRSNVVLCWSFEAAAGTILAKNRFPRALLSCLPLSHRWPIFSSLLRRERLTGCPFFFVANKNNPCSWSALAEEEAFRSGSPYL